MAAAEQQVAAAAPGLVGVGALVVDLQPHLLGKGRRHDHQRQAVAGARIEGLRGVARHRGVVLELELAALVQRIDERPLPPLAARMRCDLFVHVAPHLVVQREHVGGADPLRGRREQRVLEQRFVWRRRGGAGARGKAQTQQQRSPVAHRTHPSVERSIPLAHGTAKRV